MRICWIGQSGYIVQTDNAKIIIDPYLSDVVNKVAGRPRLVDAPIDPCKVKVDAVVCTHDHLDHLDVEAIELMDREQRFITTSEGKEKLKGMGFGNVDALPLGKSVKIGDIKLTAVYANHTVEAFGLILEAEGVRLYFSGDTLFDEKLFEISNYNPHITFICINGRLGNMNVDEAVTTAKKIGAKVNVPNHYGMFASNTEDPTLFTSRLKNSLALEFNKEYVVEDILNSFK